MNENYKFSFNLKMIYKQKLISSIHYQASASHQRNALALCYSILEATASHNATVNSCYVASRIRPSSSTVVICDDYGELDQ